MSSNVSQIAAAPSLDALEHFSRRFAFETDCWDVHHAIDNNQVDFVLLDVRSRDLFDKGHLPTAINLPHWKIRESALSKFNQGSLFVVYCAGPHCNGAQKGALALAKHGRAVKEMIGGITGWLDEGFELVKSACELGDPS